MYNWKSTDTTLYWKEDFPFSAPAIHNVAALYKKFANSQVATPPYSEKAKKELDSKFKQNLKGKGTFEFFLENFF